MRLLTIVGLLVAASSVAAFAQEEYSEGVSEMKFKGFAASPVNLQARVGLLSFADAVDNYTSRGAMGVGVQWNAAEAFEMDRNAILGLDGGFLYSHLGPQGSNFFGNDAPSSPGPSPGANAVLIPVNIMAGYRVTDKMPVMGLVGVGLLYRSVANQALVGRQDDRSDDALDPFLSLGLGVGFDLSKSFQLGLRADYIPTPRDDLFAATLGGALAL